MDKLRPMRIAMVAGEPSGDMLGAALCHALKQIDSSIVIEGIAGPDMVAAGCTPLFQMEDIAVMGLFEVVKHIPKILQIRRKLFQYLSDHPPDVFIGIDAPDFNLPLEKKLKKQGHLTVHYNSPTIWAWRKNRVHTICQSTDLMLTQFPFEAALYEKYNLPVRYVGHILADQIPMEINPAKYRQQLQLDTDDKVIALLPGSREMEIKRLGPLFIETAKWCLNKNPALQFVAPMANDSRLEQMQSLLSSNGSALPIKLILGSAQQAMAASDVVLLASGTATLEALLLQRPMVVAYKLSALSHFIGKRLVDIDKFSLPNILAEKHLVPEFIQADATAENLGEAVLQRLDNTDLVKQLVTEYQQIHLGLRRNASAQAANAVMSLYASRKNSKKETYL